MYVFLSVSYIIFTDQVIHISKALNSSWLTFFKIGGGGGLHFKSHLQFRENNNTPFLIFSNFILTIAKDCDFIMFYQKRAFF